MSEFAKGPVGKGEYSFYLLCPGFRDWLMTSHVASALCNQSEPQTCPRAEREVRIGQRHNKARNLSDNRWKIGNLN